MFKLTHLIVLSIVLSLPAHAESLKFLTFKFPPFSQNVDGKPKGPFMDLISDVCKEMDDKCTFNTLPTRRAKDQIAKGQADGIFPFGWFPKRAEKFYFSVPFMLTEYGIFVPINYQGKISGIKDLQSMQIGVFGPSNTSNSLENLQKKMVSEGLKPFKIIMKRDEDGNLIRMLESNRIDAYYSNRALGEFRVKQFNITGVKYAWEAKQLLYFVAFPKASTNKALVEKFNQAALKVFAKKGYLESKLSVWDISAPPLSEDVLKQYNILY